MDNYLGMFTREAHHADAGRRPITRLHGVAARRSCPESQYVI